MHRMLSILHRQDKRFRSSVSVTSSSTSPSAPLAPPPSARPETPAQSPPETETAPWWRYKADGLDRGQFWVDWGVLLWWRGCTERPPSWWQSGILEQRRPLCSFQERVDASNLRLWLQNTHFLIFFMLWQQWCLQCHPTCPLDGTTTHFL